MLFRFSIIALLILCAAGCAKQPKRPIPAMPTETVKVKVNVDGKIYFNERVVTLDELKAELLRLKQIRGAVWFSDDSSSGAAREHGQLVKKAIIEAELLMRIR